MKLGHWQKFQKLHSLSTQGAEIELMFALRAAVSEILTIFLKLPYLGRKLGHWQKFRSCTYTLFLSLGVETELMFTLRAAVSEILAVFQNGHIWARSFSIGKSANSCTCALFLPQRGRNWAYFRSTGSGFWDIGRFSKLPYLGMKLGHWQKFQKLRTYSLSTPGGGADRN